LNDSNLKKPVKIKVIPARSSPTQANVSFTLESEAQRGEKMEEEEEGEGGSMLMIIVFSAVL
jgi:hypothetical protein